MGESLQQSQIEAEIRAVLKRKAFSDDRTVSISKMVAKYGMSESELVAIVKQYQSELIATEFIIIA